MAGEGHLFAKVLCSVWSDDDFVALTPNAQRMYLFLLSQKRLSWVGSLDYSPTRWTRSAAGLELEDVDLALGELVARRFVIIDRFTEELLIRTYVRHDQVCKSWPLTAAMWKAWCKVESRMLQRAVLAELPIEAWGYEKAPAPDAAQRLAQDPYEGPYEAPSVGTYEAACEEPIEGDSHQPSTFNLQPSTLNHQPLAEIEPSTTPEADELCEYLARHIEAHRGNGKRPKVTAAWQRDMALLLRRGELHVDGTQGWTPAECRFAIDAIFSRLHERSTAGFCWADQIQSPQGLREKWHKIEPLLVRAFAEASDNLGMAERWADR